MSLIRSRSSAVVLLLVTSLALPPPLLADERFEQACSLLRRLNIVDTDATPRDHPLTRMARNLDLSDLTKAANGYAEDMVAIRQQLNEFFQKDSAIPPPAGSKPHITPEQAEGLHKSIRNHPIVGLEATRKIYDPEGCWGFCFGRATVAHLESVANGIEPNSVFKIWVSGPMKSNRLFNSFYGMKWDFHVAALFKASDGRWLVVDPFYAKVLTAEQWMTIHQQYAERNYQLLFTVSDPRRYEPDSLNMYNTGHFLKDPNPDFAAISNYHQDFLQDLFRRTP